MKSVELFKIVELEKFISDNILDDGELCSIDITVSKIKYDDFLDKNKNRISKIDNGETVTIKVKNVYINLNSL